MESADEILAALKRKKVTQGSIAEALGLSQPNAATLYKPGKNGKLRKLTYDEGKLLIERFSLVDPVAAEPEVQPAYALPSADAIRVVLDVVLSSVPDAKVSASALRPASTALALCLQLLAKNPAIAANLDSVKAAALGVVARPPDSTPEE